MKEFKTQVLDSGWTIVIGIAIFGPFALPLLWRNPKLSRKVKTLWTFVTIALTLLCLWAMKYSAMQLSNAMAAEPCRLERHRPAYPPGERDVKVFVGTSSKKPVEKFSQSKALFEYLKQANGKVCDVNWTEVKSMIEDWLNSWQSAEASVGPELNQLIAQQTQKTTSTATTTAEKTATPQPANFKTCESTLMQVRDRLSALKAKSYDSQKIRSEEINSILRMIEPGPLK